MKLPEPGQLVATVKATLGARTDKQLDLALYSRYGVSPGQPQISKWMRGNARPNYDHTLLLLHAAGWLNTKAIARDRPELAEALQAGAAAEQTAERELQHGRPPRAAQARSGRKR